MDTNSQVYRLRIYMLGSFYLEVDGKEISTADWRSKKALNLFRYLAARRGEKVPKDRLIEVLWPESDHGGSMEQNLHTCVYFARRVIEPNLQAYGKSEFILYSNGLYHLAPCEPCWVDVERFERLYEEGKALTKEDSSRAIGVFKSALGLYRGDFLAEDPYLEWAADAREYYREMYLDAALRVSALVADVTHDIGEAIRLCRTALRKDPYREDLHYAVIGYLVQAGRSTEAATQYRAYARMMREEFGLEPSREAKALLSRLLPGRQQVAGTNDREATSSKGAFLCDEKTFESICSLERRRQERSQQPVTFMLVSMSKEGSGQVMQQLPLVASSLRRGDTVCQWNSNTIAICLWGTGEIGARVVSRRLKRDLEHDACGPVNVTYDVLKDGDDGSPLGILLQKAR